MSTILGAAASGLQHNQNVMDVVGNNLANVNSIAYKKVRPNAGGAPNAQASPDGGRLGVSETNLVQIFNVGAAQSTEDPLHFAIRDDTFFRVKDLDGATVYTRFGALTTDSERNVVAFGGRLLELPVTIPDGMTQPAVSTGGVISALDSAGVRQDLGQITLVRFLNPQGLEAIGDGLYRESANSGPLTEGTPGSEGFDTLVTGAVEASNVDVAEEFVTMLMAQRAYSAAAKTFSVGDEMLLIATDLTR